MKPVITGYTYGCLCAVLPDLRLHSFIRVACAWHRRDLFNPAMHSGDLSMRSATFNVFGLATRRSSVGRYAEFLQAPTLHAGLYELEAGAVDKQQPHDDDEIYYVISGRANFFVEENSRPIQPGDVIYVAAGEAHRFEDIEQDLKLLVVFGPPARSLPPD